MGITSFYSIVLWLEKLVSLTHEILYQAGKRLAWDKHPSLFSQSKSEEERVI
jgi:hypothetical protein